jgi:carboxypeptidase C (cathepsin A)
MKKARGKRTLYGSGPHEQPDRCCRGNFTRDFQRTSYLPEKANLPWNWGSARKGFPDVGETLRRAMSKNRKLEVFIANSLYDLAPSHLAACYAIHHPGLDPGFRKNTTVCYYEAGHRRYVRPSSVKKSRAQVAEFMKGAGPVNGAL